MARGKPTHRPAIRFRVEDENNSISSTAQLGGAVGWAKMFIAQQNRRLIRGGKRKLPKMKWTHAWPGKGIKRIEIESSPYWGWNVRIIGGRGFGGAFLWFPWDDDRRVSQFATYNSIQQLTKSEGNGGPYTVRQEPDYEAGIIDWKGPLITEDSQGNELNPPLRNVLSWEGPRNRYQGDQISFDFNTSPDKMFAWKDGQKYLRIPDTFMLGGFDSRKYDGVADPENDAKVEPGFGQVSGICAAAIQTQGNESRDVIIVERIYGSTVNPPVGRVEWYVFWRPANAGLSTNGVWRASVNNDDPNKWRLISVLPGPSDFTQGRWFNYRTWYFNQSGTEAGSMITVNAAGDFAANPTLIPVLSGGDGSTTITVAEANFPYVLQEGTINVDAFAETATVTYGARSGTETTGQRVVGDPACGVSGSYEVQCDGSTVTGSITETYSRSSGTTWTGSTQWNVAVDYKGDTRVYATMVANGSDTISESYTATYPGSGASSGSISQIRNILATAQLSIGATVLPLVDWDYTTTGTQNSFNGTFISQGAAGQVENGYPRISSTEASVGWMDLRNDLAVWAYRGVGTGTTSVSGGDWYSGGTRLQPGPVGSSLKHRILWSGQPNHSTTAECVIAVVEGGTTLTSYTVTQTDALRVFTPLVDIGGVGWGLDNTQGTACEAGDVANFTQILTPTNAVCPSPDPGSTTSLDAPGPPSLESLDIGSQSGSLQPQRTTYAGTDGAGNVAVSVHTWAQDSANQNVQFGPRVVTFFATNYPDTPRWLNWLTGDDLVDVMNSITGIDPGPDGDFGTADDIEQPPLDDTKGPHAFQIRVIG